MKLQAIILAGGLGTRLRSAVPDLPKCMAPVRGVPFLAYLIAYLRRQGVHEFIFSLGYRHGIIEDFLNRHLPARQYSCVVEQEPLGTGGGIQLACRQAKGPEVLVLNGDTFFEANIPQLQHFHQIHAADCSLVLRPMQNFDRYGAVEINNEERITAFHEKQFYSAGLINGGVYLLNRQHFLDQGFPEKFSFEKDYLEQIQPRRKLYGCEQDAYFIDIGIPEDYARAQMELPEQADRQKKQD